MLSLHGTKSAKDTARQGPTLVDARPALTQRPSGRQRKSFLKSAQAASIRTSTATIPKALTVRYIALALRSIFNRKVAIASAGRLELGRLLIAIWAHTAQATNPRQAHYAVRWDRLDYTCVVIPYVSDARTYRPTRHQFRWVWREHGFELTRVDRLLVEPCRPCLGTEDHRQSVVKLGAQLIWRCRDDR